MLRVVHGNHLKPDLSDVTPCALNHCYVCALYKFICWNLTPNMMIFEDGILGRPSGHKGAASMNEVSTLLKETVLPSTTWGLSEKKGPHSNTTAVVSLCQTSSLQSWVEQVLVYKPPSLCPSVTAACTRHQVSLYLGKVAMLMIF